MTKMEPSIKTITIGKEIKFKKADLVAMKESKNGKCQSAMHRVCIISNVQYCVTIYPNGCEDAERGQTHVCLLIKFENATKVEADIELQCANTSIKINEKYKHPKDSWSNQVCTTEELFDATKKFIVIDEMIIKVKGTMKIYLPTNIMMYPFSAQWKVKQADAESFKFSTNGKKNWLRSKQFKLSSDSDMKYCLIFYPNDEKHRGKALLLFHLKLGGAKKLKAIYNISIDSANYTIDEEDMFEESSGWTNEICSTEELFKPENHYFINGEMLIKVSGTVSMEKESLTAVGCEENTVKKDHTVDQGKDFTILVGEKSIKVHNKLLLDSSPYFIGLFNSGMIESVEMKTTIKDFDYEIVEAGIEILYDPKIPSNFTFEQMLELLRFSDKYDISAIKDLLQNHFIKSISPTNVCSLINYTTTTVSAPKLHEKCIEYIIERSEEKMAIHGLETLDKDLLLKLFTGTFVQNL